MRITIILLCFLVFALPLKSDEPEQELLESARLGSAEYNISIQFLQDDLLELTLTERKEQITELSDLLEKKKLTPLQTVDLISLLNMEGLKEEKMEVVKSLSFRLDTILTKNPKDHEALLAIVKLDRRYGDNTVINSLLADSTIEKVTYLSLLIELADIHVCYANYEDAEKIIDHVLNFDSLNTEALVMKTLIRATAKLFSLLNQQLQLFEKKLAESQSNEHLDITVSQIKETFDSIDFSPVHRVLKSDPENFKYNFFIGAVQEFIVYMHYVVLIGIYEEDKLPILTEEKITMLKEIKSYLDTAVKNKPPGDVDALIALAMYYLVLSNFDLAKEYTQMAIETRPDIDQPYDALITVINVHRLLIEEDAEAGFRESDEALKKKGMNKELNLVDRLMFLHPLIYEYRYQETLSELDKIEKDFPDGEVQLILFRGGILLRMGKMDEGLEVLHKAMKLEPDNVDIQYNLGLAYFVKDQLDLAMVHLNQASQLAPSDVEVIELINKIKKLK